MKKNKRRTTNTILLGTLVFAAAGVRTIRGQTADSFGQLAADAAAADKASQGEPITLNVKDADLSSVLKLWAEQRKLNIMAGKDVTGKVTADLYGVTLDEALRAVLEVNGYGYLQKGNFIYIYTKEQLAEMKLKEAAVETRIYQLNYINVDDARQIIQPALSDKAKVATTSRASEGIPSGGDTVGGDSISGRDALVISDYV
ncbi:MAG: hypothetical protein GWP05_09080, partial [Anaerolineaceae bacterium]|nr:hypothetical protein [Anaerolineaceae bacterium]